jgi:hypothetical protein
MFGFISRKKSDPARELDLLMEETSKILYSGDRSEDSLLRMKAIMGLVREKIVVLPRKDARVFVEKYAHELSRFKMLVSK